MDFSWKFYLDSKFCVVINNIELLPYKETSEKIIWRILKRMDSFGWREVVATITLDDMYFFRDGNELIKWKPLYQSLSTDEKIFVDRIISLFNERQMLNGGAIRTTPKRKIKETIKLPKGTLNDNELKKLDSK